MKLIFCVLNPDYYPEHDVLTIVIFEIYDNNSAAIISQFDFDFSKQGGKYYNSDLIFLTETKAIYIALHFHGKTFSLYVLNFFEDYKHLMLKRFDLNVQGKSLFIRTRYSLLFKYKDVLGLQIENIGRENGFILFGYYNSTDPKQIYNLKKDGLNYKINLGDYLTLQSNVFGYEIKYIKVVEIPNLNSSGIYLT